MVQTSSKQSGLFQSAPAIIWQGNFSARIRSSSDVSFNPPLPLFGRGTTPTPKSSGWRSGFNPPLPLFGRGTTSILIVASAVGKVSIRPCHYLAGERAYSIIGRCAEKFQSAPAIIWQGNPKEAGQPIYLVEFQSAPAIIWQGNVMPSLNLASAGCFNPPLPLFGRGTKAGITKAEVEMFQSAPAIIWQGNNAHRFKNGLFACFNPHLPLFGRGTYSSSAFSSSDTRFQSAPAIIWQGNRSATSPVSGGQMFQSAPAIIWQGNRCSLTDLVCLSGFNPPLPLFGRGT